MSVNTNNVVPTVTAQKILNNCIYVSDEVNSMKEIDKIKFILNSFVSSGVAQLGNGYCVGMSDIIHTLLNQYGIPCRVLECTLLATNKSSGKIIAVGFDGAQVDRNQVATHVIVVTETEPKLIIDMSIGHVLLNGKVGVVCPVTQSEENIVCQIDVGDIILTYKEKENASIPKMHHDSIIKRIDMDFNIFKNIKLLKTLVAIAIVISTINAGRGLYDFYSVYVNHDNMWGPSGIENISKRLDKIEEILKKR